VKVHTIFGLIDREDLEVKDVISETENGRCLAMEWRLKRDLMGTIDGKSGFLIYDHPVDGPIESRKGALARRDASVAVLRPQLFGAEQQSI
jgi:hypothetical protein